MVTTEEVKTYLLNQIENFKFPLSDKNSCNDLRKMCMTELKLNKNYYGMVNQVLRKILQEKNLSIVGGNPSKTVGGIKIEVPPAPDKIISTAPEKTDEQRIKENSGKISETTKPDEPKILISPEEQKKNNQEAFREVFLFVEDIYSALGIIEGKGKVEFEEMSREAFRVRSVEYADRLGGFCQRHNIKIPMLVEVLGIAGTGIALFVLPLLKTFFMKTEKTKLDESLKDAQTEVRVQ